jgi:hypothetical protein
MRIHLLRAVAGVCLLLISIACSKTPSAKPQNATGGSAVAPREAPPNGIRSVDLDAWLQAHLGELNPDLANLRCDQGKSTIVNQWATQYIDLDGDGQEEAVVHAWSCRSGFGDAKERSNCVLSYPPDIIGILKLLPTGRITVLRLPPMPETFQGRKVKQGLGRLGRLNPENGKIVAAYETLDPNGCSDGERHFVYSWDGRRFVLDDVVEVADL